MVFIVCVCVYARARAHAQCYDLCVLTFHQVLGASHRARWCRFKALNLYSEGIWFEAILLNIPTKVVVLLSLSRHMV
jgi:hypothetical protein